ncbi:hypothetical protein [Myroides sp. N17-2]|uniref:hypothetical protein n=1 Tax=Myroides sp. N17-2 TaxID=2030799 RepID=UPI000EFC18F5|nr:hypothetical protein [Myroides sp. N17-2]
MDLEGVVNNKLVIVPVETRSYLKKSSTYAKWISIIGFIFCGLLILVALGLLLGLSYMESVIPGFGLLWILGGDKFMYFGVGILVFVGIMILLLIKVFKFSALTSSSLLNENNEELELGLKELKSYFVFIGALVIVGIISGLGLLVFAMSVIARI